MSTCSPTAVARPVGETTGLLMEATDVLGHLENNIAALDDELGAVTKGHTPDDAPPAPRTSMNTSLGNSAQEILSRLMACNQHIGDIRERLTV